MALATIRTLCDQAIALLRGKRLILTPAELPELNELDYVGLAELHAQEEAVVCAMHFERVLDRLQEMYPWVFCRKQYQYGDIRGKLPDDFLTMLCVMENEQPIEYEIKDGKLKPYNADKIIYTAKVKDVSQWPPIFCDVFVYALAIEICPAVTGKAEYVQVLEQKAQELIHRAQQIGAIKAETRLTLQEELYNRAIGLSRGQRSLKTTSAGAVEQGADNAGFVNDRMTAEYQACVRASGRVRDRLLELYAWRFARKYTYLHDKATVNNGWQFGYTLPYDCVKLLNVLTEDGTPVDFEEVSGYVCCKVENPKIRYTARITNPEEWTGIFADVYCYNLAQEIIMSTTANPETIQLLEAKAQSLIREAHRLGEIRAEVKIPAGEEIYNRAIALVRGQRILSPSGGTAAEQGADFTGDINYREREAIAVCKRSLPEIRDKLLRLYAWKFARCTAALNQSGKKSGWNYAYTKPADCMKVLAVLSGDEPVEYEEADGLILSNNSGSMTVRYVKAITELSELDPVFKEVLCYELAEEISAALTWNAESISLLEQKKQQIIQNAYKTGIIQEETIIPLKDELIARAVRLSYGTRTTSPMSENATAQGIDNAGMRDVRYLQAVQTAKNSYEMVRRNLQEMYPWTFLRKTGELTGTGSVSGWSNAYSRPSDCLAVLNVIVDDEPVYYEELGDKILCDGAGASARYSREVEDLKNCPPMFREVFCQRLAQEVIMSTTNDVNVWQLLEQKITQIVQHGYMNGQIQNETHISLKQEIYNRAISLSHGERTPKTTSEAAQSIDYAGMKNPRNIEEIRVCKHSMPSVRDKLLQLYPWVFARKNAELTPTESISGWSNGYSLPADCMNVLTVLADNEPVDYEVINGCVYCNSVGASVRYTARVEEVNTWPGAFVDAVCYELAEEIISAITGNNESIAVLEQKKQAAIAEAYKVGTIKTETRIPAKYELFNRAIGLVKGLKTEKLDMLDTRYEDELSTCRRSYESIRNRLLQSYAWVFARRTETPARLSESVPGWRYTYMLPADCLRVIAVIGQDRRAEWGGEMTCRNISDFSDKVELTEYETAGRELYANRDVVYVRYTAKIDDSAQWEAVFTEAFVILLGIEIALNVVGDKNIIAILEQRLTRLIEDAKLSGAIREETKLPKQRESIRAVAANRQFLDYSGIPTLPCDTGYPYIMRGRAMKVEQVSFAAVR